MIMFKPVKVMSFLISAILLAACGGTPLNSPTPTPTSMAVLLPPAEQATSLPTEAPTVGAQSSPSSVTEQNVCSLASSADVAPVLGSTPIAASPGSDPDNSTGVTIYFCTYLGQGVAVVISVADTASAQAAAELMQNQITQMQTDTPGTTSTQETGLGDQLFWNVAENGVSYNVQIGARAFSIGLGGAIGDPASHKAALLDLARKVASAN